MPCCGCGRLAAACTRRSRASCQATEGGPKPMPEQTSVDSLVVRYEELRAAGTPVSAEALCDGCPELLPELQRQIRVLESMDALLGDVDGRATGDTAAEPGTAALS